MASRENEKAVDKTDSEAVDRRDKAKARTKTGDGETEHEVIQETVELWRDGTGSAMDKL